MDYFSGADIPANAWMDICASLHSEWGKYYLNFIYNNHQILIYSHEVKELIIIIAKRYPTSGASAQKSYKSDKRMDIIIIIIM